MLMDMVLPESSLRGFVIAMARREGVVERCLRWNRTSGFRWSDWSVDELVGSDIRHDGAKKSRYSGAAVCMKRCEALAGR